MGAHLCCCSKNQYSDETQKLISVALRHTMHSVPVKVFTGKNVKVTKSTSVHELLENYETVEIPISSTTTFDDLLRKCAIKCHVLPLYLPLFALWDPITDSWMKLSDTIDPTLLSRNAESSFDDCLEFRIRFIVKTEVQMGGQKKVARRWSNNLDETGSGQMKPAPFMDEIVIAYLYRQRREDFLMDKIEFTDNKKTENYIFSAALGVAVLDMLCLSKITDSNITTISEKVKFKHLLPKSCQQEMKDFNFCNRIRVKNKFKHYLRYFSPTAEDWQQKGRSLAFFQQRYLLNLELFSASYGVERYCLAKSGFITVSADSGITLHSDGAKDNAEKWCSFSELTDMTLQVRHPDENTSSGIPSLSQNQNDLPPNMCVVSLGRFDGSVKKFAMKSVKSAENLASCIDGYYHLLVDAHHYLCTEICSPSLVQHIKLGCHGPISCSFAENLLREREAKGNVQIGDCIIRQSQESYDEYFVNTICKLTPLEIRNFKLDRRNGQLGLFGWVQSHKHDTLADLLNACSNGLYNGQEIPIRPDLRIHPKIKHKSNLIVLLSSDESDEVSDPSNIQHMVTKMVLIELSDYREVTPLGNGCFTSVIRYARMENTDKYVVFKSILDQKEEQQNHHLNRSFQESTAMLNRLSHQHIVQHIGMTLSNMVALEYLPHHSITTYLKTNQNNMGGERMSWFLQVLWQITHACNYLEQSGFAHGNLCGKNVLLQKDFPQPHIKLADPGVRTGIITRNHKNIAAPILTAPWLSHEFCLVDSEPNFSRYPTIEGDKWSFATTVCEILNWAYVGVDPMNGYDLTADVKELYRHGNLKVSLHMPELITANEELCKLICLCWCTIPDKRPPFQQILRELGSTLTSDYVFLTVNTGPVTDVICELKHGLPTYEDEKLTRHGLLGEGHFGSVELFSYDQYRNGQTEKVAVKKLIERTIRHQHDFTQEIETMRHINHPYVVRLLGIATPSGRIVMEYVQLGSLADELRRRRNNNNRMHVSMLLRFSSQIAEGMIALQQKRIIHRDLALRNILLGCESNNLHIKISDFGLSRFVSEDTHMYVGKLKEFPAHWYAPEFLFMDETRAFGFESDVWSFGITIWEMFSHAERPTYPPLPPATDGSMLPILRAHLRAGNRLERSPDCPNVVHNIMLRCWAFTPSERLSFEDIQQEFEHLFPYANDLSLMPQD